MDNKEYGSDFHYFYDEDQDISMGEILSDANLEYFFSGRVALYNLLEFGIKNYGWHTVGFPSYYCHEVVDFCKKLDLKVFYYDYNPIDINMNIDWEDKKGNVFVNVDFFGINKLDCSRLKNSVVIEDLTHNLESLSVSSADYCFGSLRKQIPLATGGFAWSREGDFSVNLAESNFSNKIALQKLVGMYLKKEFLEGTFFEKEIFRTLITEAEEQFASFQTNSPMPKIVHAQLEGLLLQKLFEKTQQNVSYCRKKIVSSKHIVSLSTEKSTEMGLLFLCDSNYLREKFRSYLITNSIYPAVLWPNQFRDRDIEIQCRIVFIHVDFRYNKNDIRFITDTINKFISNV